MQGQRKDRRIFLQEATFFISKWIILFKQKKQHSHCT